MNVDSETRGHGAGRVGALLAASGAYFTSNFLLLVAGLISMPIMTRLLSKDDYGLLNLVFVIVSMLVVVGGFGLGEAMVRFYGERRADGQAALRRLCESLFGGALSLGMLMGLMVAGFAAAVPGVSSAYGRCLLLASVLILVRSVSGVLYQTYRAQERAVAHAATQVFVRYASSAPAIALLLLYEPAAFTVLLATVLVETTAGVA